MLVQSMPAVASCLLAHVLFGRALTLRERAERCLVQAPPTPAVDFEQSELVIFANCRQVPAPAHTHDVMHKHHSMHAWVSAGPAEQPELHRAAAA